MDEKILKIKNDLLYTRGKYVARLEDEVLRNNKTVVGNTLRHILEIDDQLDAINKPHRVDVQDIITEYKKMSQLQRIVKYDISELALPLALAISIGLVIMAIAIEISKYYIQIVVK